MILKISYPKNYSIRIQLTMVCPAMKMKDGRSEADGVSALGALEFLFSMGVYAVSMVTLVMLTVFAKVLYIHPVACLPMLAYVTASGP